MAEVVHFKAHKATYVFTGSFCGTMLFKKSRVLLCGAVLYGQCWCWVYSVSSLLSSSKEEDIGLFNEKNLSLCQTEGRDIFNQQSVWEVSMESPKHCKLAFSGIQLPINVKQTFILSSPPFLQFPTSELYFTSKPPMLPSSFSPLLILLFHPLFDLFLYPIWLIGFHH